MGRITKRTTYDGTYFFKVHSIDTIVANSATQASYIIGGGQSGVSSAGSSAYIDDNPEW